MTCDEFKQLIRDSRLQLLSRIVNLFRLFKFGRHYSNLLNYVSDFTLLKCKSFIYVNQCFFALQILLDFLQVNFFSVYVHCMLPGRAVSVDSRKSAEDSLQSLPRRYRSCVVGIGYRPPGTGAVTF